MAERTDLDETTARTLEILEVMWDRYVAFVVAARALSGIKTDDAEHLKTIEMTNDRAQEIEDALLSLPPEEDGKYWCHIAAVQQAIRLHHNESRDVATYRQVAEQCGRDYWAELETWPPPKVT